MDKNCFDINNKDHIMTLYEISKNTNGKRMNLTPFEDLDDTENDIYYFPTQTNKELRFPKEEFKIRMNRLLDYASEYFVKKAQYGNQPISLFRKCRNFEFLFNIIFNGAKPIIIEDDKNYKYESFKDWEYIKSRREISDESKITASKLLNILKTLNLQYPRKRFTTKEIQKDFELINLTPQKIQRYFDYLRHKGYPICSDVNGFCYSTNTDDLLNTMIHLTKRFYGECDNIKSLNQHLPDNLKMHITATTNSGGLLEI